MKIEFYDGAIAEELGIADVEMKAPPRLGEFVLFNFKGVRERYQIISVEYQINSPDVRRSGIIDVESSLSLVKCGCMQLSRESRA